MFNKSYNIAATEKANMELSNSFMKCNVKLLDESIETFNLSTQARGLNLLDSVCDSLELLERDYFGIQYLWDDGAQIWKWMKMDKLIRKQIKGDVMSRIFNLKVRFVPADVIQMQETYTRYQLFLQIKQDIHSSRIICPKDISVQLAGYALQSELGDHNTTILKQGYVGEFRFIPEQTPSFEAEVANFHKSLRGIRSEDAELKFLTTAKQLPQYGCDLYNCQLMEKPIQFGFHSIGISIFPAEPNGSFIIPWNSLDTVSNKKKSLIIKILGSQPIYSLNDVGVTNSLQNVKRANLHKYDHKKSGFKLFFPTIEEAKEAWRSCVDNHSFFRVKDPKQVQSSVFLKRSNSFFKLVSVRSLFSGRRTLPELLDIRRRNRTIERSFIRIPSKRYIKKHTGQSEKQSIISAPESVRLTGIIHTRQNKAPPMSASNSKDKTKTDTKKESYDSESESSEIVALQNEPVQFRPKSIITQSVRLDKSNTNKELSHLSVTHSSIPRKPRNIYSKSLSVDDDRKCFDSNTNDATLRITNNTKTVTTQRPSSTIYEMKSQSITKSHSKAKLSGSISPTKNSLSNLTTSINQSSDKLVDLDNFVEVTIKAQDNRYGFTIQGGSDIGTPVIVTKVAPGSAADVCIPNLFEGDQIIKINNRFAEELTHEEIKEIIRSTGQRKDNQLVLIVKSRLYMADDLMSAEELSEEDADAFLAVLHKPITNDIRTEMKLLDDSLKNGTALTQFERLYKQKQGLSMNEAKKIDNINKNRYKDILPYDQTRIIMKNNEYINANLIKYDIAKSSTSLKYIATQGPLAQTVNDFLTMVWEHKIQLIVMLTELQEKGRSKCFKYWPDHGETTKLVHGHQISCESEETHETFVIREMKIKKSNETRKLIQLQYLNWPDHDVPERIEDFISFIKTMRQLRINKLESLLVHCSAGIGRTGIVITMDIAIAYMEQKSPFSVLSIVKQIRNQRAMLIQTQKQYEFVCRAIVHYFSANFK